MRRIFIIVVALLSTTASASVAYVRGVNTSWADNTAHPAATISCTAGDSLVVTLGIVANGFGENILRDIRIADNQSGVYIWAAVSPAQSDNNNGGVQMISFLGTNCAGGSTTVTMSYHNGSNFGRGAMVIDEYSSVPTRQAIDGITFSSTQYAGGGTSIGSGTITITGTELVYSAAFTNDGSETFTPSAGFTQRENQNGANTVSLATFDKSFTGGTASNTVSVSGTPPVLQNITFALSPSAINNGILQICPGVWNSTSGPSITVVCPYPTAAGSLGVMVTRVGNRTGINASDTQGNLWTVEPEDHNLAIGFTSSLKAGSLSVTVSSTGGGSDNSWLTIVVEYADRNASFISANSGFANPGASVNTGNVAVSAANSLLVSGGLAGNTIAAPNVPEPPMGTSPGIWRFQLSDLGFLNQQLATLALSDQVENSPGTYSNTFTPSSSLENLSAAILGYSLPAVASSFTYHVFSQRSSK